MTDALPRADADPATGESVTGPQAPAGRAGRGLALASRVLALGGLAGMLPAVITAGAWRPAWVVDAVVLATVTAVAVGAVRLQLLRPRHDAWWYLVGAVGSGTGYTAAAVISSRLHAARAVPVLDHPVDADRSLALAVVAGVWLLAAAVLGVLAGREAADGGGQARAYVVNPVLFSLSRRIPAIAVVVATVALTAYGAVLVPQLRVQATVTTASPGPVAPVPALATVDRGDTWSRTFTADRHGPQRVLRGARGPLVVGPGGVVALEGSSGSELWRYRIQQPEGVTSLAAASPDGRFVVLLVFTFGDSAIDPAQTRMVVLDGATGSVRAALYLPGVAPRASYSGADVAPDWIMVDDHQVVMDQGTQIVARALPTGGWLWAHDTSEGCHSRPLLSDDVVILFSGCAPSPRLLTGLDAATGSPRWEHPVSGLAADARAYENWRTAPDGGLVDYRAVSAGSGTDSVEWLLESATGAIRAQAGSPSSAAQFRPLGGGWWLTTHYVPPLAEWDRRVSGYDLIAPSGQRRTLSLRDGECLATADEVTAGPGGWACGIQLFHEDWTETRADQVRLVMSDPATAPSPAPLPGNAEVLACPGALVTWRPSRAAGSDLSVVQLTGHR